MVINGGFVLAFHKLAPSKDFTYFSVEVTMQRQSDTCGHNSGNGRVKGTAKKGTTDCSETGLMAAAFSRFEQEQRKAATMMKLNEDSVRSLVQNKWKKMTPDKKAECLSPHEKVKLPTY